MTEIRFYHLHTRTLDQALPEIVQKALSAGHRIHIRAANDAEIDRLNNLLWTFRPDSFVPHGSEKDGHGTDQPVWLSTSNDAPNNANVLILTGGIQEDDLTPFTLACDIFDGRHDENVTAARQRWKAYKDAGHNLTYWQQTEKGWEQKA